MLTDVLCRDARRAFSSTATQRAFEVKRLGVVGAGQMGLGIALVAATQAKLPVHLIDNSQTSLDKALAFARKLLDKDVTKGRLTSESAAAAHALITPSTTLSSLSTTDFIIEAIPEIPSLKEHLFADLSSLAPNHTILASNTSSISITKLAAAAGPIAAPRVVATHFMNPVPVQRGVEIISALQTSPETLAAATELVKVMGKIPAVSADRPGFLANRILMPYINEAILCLESGTGGREDIDGIMKYGTNVPMGPLMLADFIGLDTCWAIMKVLHEETGDSKYRPAVLLGNMVKAGWLGKKSGKGFYEY